MISNAVAVVAVLVAVYCAHMARLARADARQVVDLLVEAEDLWADRHRLAVTRRDAVSQLAAMTTQADIVRASAELGARHGI